MSEKPNYAPVHRVPAWVSGEDVRAAIKRIADQYGSNDAKAFAWDLNYEIRKLENAATPPAADAGTGSEE